MSVKIRLQLKGKKKKKNYIIVVSDSRRSRNGKVIKKLGTYNTYKKEINIVDNNKNNIIIWLKRGAIPTKTVKTILTKIGINNKIYS